MAQFGSVQNLMAGQSASRQQPTPEVGMGVSHVAWTDRQAYTCIEVNGPKRITVQRDRAIRTDANGMSDAQAYRFERNPEGPTRVLTLRRNGKWVPEGDTAAAPGWLIDVRVEYHDYSF